MFKNALISLKWMLHALAMADILFIYFIFLRKANSHGKKTSGWGGAVVSMLDWQSETWVPFTDRATFNYPYPSHKVVQNIFLFNFWYILIYFYNTLYPYLSPKRVIDNSIHVGVHITPIDVIKQRWLHSVHWSYRSGTSKISSNHKPLTTHDEWRKQTAKCLLTNNDTCIFVTVVLKLCPIGSVRRLRTCDPPASGRKLCQH